jgi:hypothetical protein
MLAKAWFEETVEALAGTIAQLGRLDALAATLG